MKKYGRIKFIAGAAAAIAFMASCVVDPAKTGPEETAPEGEGFFSVSLVIDNKGQSGTRAGDITEVKGTPAENYVRKVRIVLYSKDDDIVKYAFDFTIKSVDNYVSGPGFEEFHYDGMWDYGNMVPGMEIGHIEGSEKHLYRSAGDTHLVTWARRVVKGEYNMLAVLNPTEGGDHTFWGNDWPYGGTNISYLTQVGSHLSRITDAFQLDPANIREYVMFPNPDWEDAVLGPARDYNFTMTNHQGLVPVSTNDIYGSVTAANENPVNVKVSRVVAKLSLDTEYATAHPNGQVNFLDWEPDVQNRHMYWMRNLAELIAPDGSKGAQETLNDGSERKYQYAKDPNFSGFSTAGGSTAVQRNGQFAYICNRVMQNNLNYYDDTKQYPTYYRSVTPNITPLLQNAYAPSSDMQYVLENTFEPEDYAQETATSIIVRATYTPNGVSWSTGQGYFVFNSKLIPWDRMLVFVADPSQINKYIGLDGLATVIEAIKSDRAAGISGTPDLSQMASGGITSSFDLYALRFYLNGINYYRVPVTHYGDTALDPATSYGYYGVVRNNHYAVTIESVTGPGAPTLKPTPDNGNIAASIRILPWKDRIQDTEL